jgi:outer membrane protein
MKQSTFGLVIAAALLAAGTASAQAPSNKLGMVSMDRVLRDARVSLQAQQALEAEYKKRDAEIAAGPPGEAARRRQALVEDISLRRDEALKQVVDKANIAIKRVAEEENFDAVFFEAAYAAPRIDLTDKVIKALDAAR